MQTEPRGGKHAKAGKFFTTEYAEYTEKEERKNGGYLVVLRFLVAFLFFSVYSVVIFPESETPRKAARR
jgi:hypothetical protein